MISLFVSLLHFYIVTKFWIHVFSDIGKDTGYLNFREKVGLVRNKKKIWIDKIYNNMSEAACEK